VKDRLLAKLRMPDGSINPWVIAVTVTLATFMEVLDTSIANVALPHISGSFVGQRGRVHVDPDVLSGIERHHPAAFGLVLRINRTQALLHVVRGAIPQ